MTYEEIRRLMGHRKIHTLGNNVVLVGDGNGVVLTHYDQVIAKWTNSSFEIVAPNYVNNGKLSVTTVKVINKYAPPLTRVSSNKSGTYLYLNGVKVQELRL